MTSFRSSSKSIRAHNLLRTRCCEFLLQVEPPRLDQQSSLIRLAGAADDPLKADWLSRMNQLYSSSPRIPPGIRNWLQEECELIDVSGPSLLEPVGRARPKPYHSLPFHAISLPDFARAPAPSLHRQTSAWFPGLREHSLPEDLSAMEGI